MAPIVRAPQEASQRRHDLIVVGGGIYGAMLAMESARRGMRSLLVEQSDFGSATSFNSLRILHGGFRYLQNFNLSRFFVSVRERSWFVRTFPGLTRPMPFLMPLYGQGLRKPNLLKAALHINHYLSVLAEYGQGSLAPGRVVDPGTTRKIFPGVRTQGLVGGGVWFDAIMPDSQRILMEILRWACSEGATALNYVQAVKVLRNSFRVQGIVARDEESGEQLEFRAKAVINAAGPWCRRLVRPWHRDFPQLFKPSLAWNVLLDKELLSDHAVAVTPGTPGGRTYFLLPWKGKILAGTGHAAWDLEPERPQPSREQLASFLQDLNLAVPGLDAGPEDVQRIFSGLLPAVKEGGCRLLDRPVIVDHGRLGGPQGLFSVSGVKFTTARHVALKTLSCIAKSSLPGAEDLLSRNRNVQPLPHALPTIADPGDQSFSALSTLIRQEAVLHLDDLFLRRINLWHDPVRMLDRAEEVADRFSGWDAARKKEEMERLREHALNHQF